MKVFIVMNLNEQISRIKEVMGMKDGPDKFKLGIQKIIDGFLTNIRNESEEWGLGEMDELNEVESVENIRLVDYSKKPMHFSIVIDVNSQRKDFENIIIPGVEYEIHKYIPDAEFDFKINDIRTFGPGIDW